jgi:hypothetical protein
LKRNTIASKKYIKAYNKYPKFSPKINIVIGCIYYGKNRSNHLKLGMLMEMNSVSSTLKTKEGKKIKVKTNTLKSAQLGY